MLKKSKREKECEREKEYMREKKNLISAKPTLGGTQLQGISRPTPSLAIQRQVGPRMNPLFKRTNPLQRRPRLRRRRRQRASALLLMMMTVSAGASQGAIQIRRPWNTHRVTPGPAIPMLRRGGRRRGGERRGLPNVDRNGLGVVVRVVLVAELSLKRGVPRRGWVVEELGGLGRRVLEVVRGVGGGGRGGFVGGGEREGWGCRLDLVYAAAPAVAASKRSRWRIGDRTWQEIPRVK